MSYGLRRLAFTACFVAGLLTPSLWMAATVRSFAVPHEVERITCLDGQYDAVAARFQTGVFSKRQEYEVYVVGHRAPFQRAQPVFSALNTENTEIIWEQPRLLKIQYRRARIEHFANHWGPSSTRGKLVEIRLAPTSSGHSFLNASGDLEAGTEP